jgi:hypothetical protein
MEFERGLFSVAIITWYLPFCIYPLSFSPRGKGSFTPPPVGEGWEGGNRIENYN